MYDCVLREAGQCRPTMPESTLDLGSSSESFSKVSGELCVNREQRTVFILFTILRSVTCLWILISLSHTWESIKLAYASCSLLFLGRSWWFSWVHIGNCSHSQKALWASKWCLQLAFCSGPTICSQISNMKSMREQWEWRRGENSNVISWLTW